MIKIKSFDSFFIHLFFIFLVFLILPSPLTAQPGETVTISGTVLDTRGRGVDGVSIAFYDGEVMEYATTAAGGQYSHDVYVEWSGTVTPMDECYSFTPTSYTLGPLTMNVIRDFTGSQLTNTISGIITDGPPLYDGGGNLLNPIPGVVLTLSTGGGTFSGTDGTYTLTVGCGWGGTITPLKVGWQFAPPSRFYEYIAENYPSQNFVGSASSTEYTISGQVTDESGRTGMDGVSIEFFDGVTVHTETTSGGGFYSYNVPALWSGTITPSRIGYSFTPPVATVTLILANLTQNFTGSFNNYTISGTVVGEDLAPLAGVTLTLSTGGSDITGSSGTYVFTVAHGWSGTVTPARPGYVFEPTRRTYYNADSDQLNQIYVGYQGSKRVTISGAARQADGTGIPGVTLTFLPGGETASTDDAGDYSKTVPFNWSGTATPSKTGYNFTPASRTYTSLKTDEADQDYIDHQAGSPPELLLTPTQLNFAVDTLGNTSDPQSFMVSNSGGGTLNWTITGDQGWFQYTPLSGTGPGMVTVTVNAAGLAAGTYNGLISVSDPNAVNSPQTVNVQLKVYSYSTSKPPFGDFATPLEGATVRSSIPVTGWALDDIGVVSVKIYLVNNGSLAFIGDAVFVEGARPDVELYYPDYPNNSRAGWGYMMLTYFLPNGGNGTYTLEAIATDVEGNQASLGTRTFTCDNANAVKPFGAIDAPDQGGLASGSALKNTGWVLTPMPNKIPEDGSTINVYVDGLNLGHPTYNIYREDVAVLFPGYANSNGAHAFFELDTTAFGNGVHTIYWTATDDAGNTDGVGSRFFNILNPDSPGGAASRTSGFLGGTPLKVFKTYRATGKPVDNTRPIRVKTGFHPLKTLRTLYPDKKGLLSIETGEAERIEIHFAEERVSTGYLVVGKEPRPLPLGSSLDLENNVFYWLPAPAYLGSYRLVFVVTGPDGEVGLKELTIKIRPF
jgi:hypothetical protein